MRNLLIALFISILLLPIVTAQERKFGDITVAELAETQDEIFKDEPAVLLYRDINFEYGKALEVHERIKIYNAEGFEHSDWTIYFDDIRQFKAATYNLENGKVVTTKVSKKAIFNENVSEGEEIGKLAFPNVKAGSIIELKYRVIFIGFSTLYTQMGIPIKYERISVSNGYYGKLSVRQNQYVKLPIRRLRAELTDIFIGENVPPLKEEKFVGNVNNHRGSILMELHGNTYKQTWTEVAKRYYNFSWFGQQLRNGDALYKKDLRALLKGTTDTLVMVKKIDRYVKDNIEWDNKYSRGTEFIKNVYRDKTGDSGDINLMLVHMLKSVGIRANPILIATKSKGWVKYPQANAFNTVLCAVDIGDKRYILDGSQSEASFAQVPLRYVNGMGLIVDSDEEGGFEIQEVAIQDPSKNTLIVTATLDKESLSVSGSVMKQITNYYALQHRAYYTDLKEETYEESLNKIDLLKVSNLEKKYFENPEKPVAISYDFEMQDYIEEIQDKLYFEPLLFLGSNENQFNEEDRLYPIDLDHPYTENYIITFKIPEGYQVESLPESRLIKMEEGIGSLKFDTLERAGHVQVSFTLDLQKYMIPAGYYPGLKALYGEYISISKSKIVLSKI